jgi:ATP-dependent protease ClpP protease subunit
MNQPQQPQQPKPPEGVVLTFVGPIAGEAAMQLRRACSLVVNDKVPRLKILFQSSGGGIDEGFTTYNFLRALPLELTIHAIGAVESIANIVFLAGAKRTASPHSHFMFHSFTWGFMTQHYESRQIADSQELLTHARSKFVRIFEERTNVTDQYLQDLKAFEKVAIIKPSLALEKGIVHEVAEASIPANWAAYNIDFKAG